MSKCHAEQWVAEHQKHQHQRGIPSPPDCWKRELHLLPEQIGRKQHRYNDEYRTEDVVGVATTGHIPGKYHIERNAIPCERNREIQFGEKYLRPTGFEKEPPDEQDSSNVENDLGRPDASAVGLHNTPEFVPGYHCLRPPNQCCCPHTWRVLTEKLSRSAGWAGPPHWTNLPTKPKSRDSKSAARRCRLQRVLDRRNNGEPQPRVCLLQVHAVESFAFHALIATQVV